MLQKIIDTLQAEYGMDERRILLMMATGANELDSMNHQIGLDEFDKEMHDASVYLFNETKSMMHNIISEFYKENI